MPVNVTALIYVLAIVVPMFWLAKPIALKFSSERDFNRRRNVWLILTVIGFLSPSFWLFALLAIPLLIAAARKDTNPVALYLLLLAVIPPVSADIPAIGIAHLFELDNYRLLAFCVLLPLAVRQWRSKQAAAAPIGFDALDILLLAYGTLTVVLYVPFELNHVLLSDSFTNALRRAFLFFIDIYILYFAVSRTCSSRGAIVEALAAFCLACALLAPMAVFEMMKKWSLYMALEAHWSDDPLYWWLHTLYRGTELRARVSAGHALVLGYLLAVGFGFWLYLKSRVASARTRVAGVALYWAGLFAAYSRGPWIGAASIAIVFAALGQRAFSRLLKAGALMAIAFGALLASPLGERVIDVLPAMGGSVDAENITYRQRLADRSWELISEHPFFGDQLALQKMGDLRQGQGIIDIVNTYAGVALHYGLIGLFVFLAFILTAAFRAYGLARRAAQADPDLALLGTSLIACIVGTLVMIAGCSFIFAYEKMYYVLGGLAAAYARLVPASQLQPAVAVELGLHAESAVVSRSENK
jgi:O-antigen ligase